MRNSEKYSQKFHWNNAEVLTKSMRQMELDNARYLIFNHSRACTFFSISESTNGRMVFTKA
jgi:hypothetical protein